MRSILVALFLILFFVLTSPLLLIEYLIGKFSPKKKVTSSYVLIKFALKGILLISGTKYTIMGQDRVPQDIDTGVLYVSNHRSYYDIPVFIIAAPTLTGMVAKKEMNKIPVLRRWMNNINCLFLDRDNIREGLKTILKGIDYIKDGYSMYIAPEGTRNQGDEMLPFKEGSFKMAEKAKAPIIPVSISNTDAVFERQSPWIKPAKVIIEFGEPVYIDQLEPEDKKFLAPYVQNIIKETLEKNSIN